MFLFFFNETATTEIYTLSLHDALPIYLQQLVKPMARPQGWRLACRLDLCLPPPEFPLQARLKRDRKSTRLNSSHTVISYAVFCLKKKKKKKTSYTESQHCGAKSRTNLQ